MGKRLLWWRADVLLMAVVSLALLVIGLSLGLSSNQLEHALEEMIRVCLQTLDGAVAHSADLGRFTLLLMGILGLALATVEVSWSLWMTRHWISSLQLERHSVSHRVRRLARKCGLEGRVVVVDAAHPLVFTQGLLRPRVWLSAHLLVTLSAEELEAVLWHEAHHAKQRDPLRLLIARALSRALFFIPIVRDLCAAYSARLEIAADRYVIQVMGSALPLARALRRLLNLQPAAIPARVLVGKLDVTEARLLALLNPDRVALPMPMRRLGVSLFGCLLLVAVWVSPSAGHFPTLANCASEMAQSVGFWTMG